MLVIMTFIVCVIFVFVGIVLLRRGVWWRLAMLLPTLGLSSVVGASVLNVDSLTRTQQLVIWLLPTISFYVGMLAIWRLRGAEFEQRDMRW